MLVISDMLMHSKMDQPMAVQSIDRKKLLNPKVTKVVTFGTLQYMYLALLFA